MRLVVQGIDFDQRISCYMVSAKCDYEWYLSKTVGAEQNLDIQRDVIKSNKAYRTLRSDLRKGCVLPTIVLAARSLDAAPTKNYPETNKLLDASEIDLEALRKSIEEVNPSDVDIIDGLQRTHALRQTLEDLEGEERDAFLAHSLRIEIWVSIPLYSLAYRMLLLNAGQRPMSMKHQIDILSGGLAADLHDIDGLEIIKLKDHKRRVRAGQLHLSALSQAFQAWLRRNANVDTSNLVLETLVVEETLDSLGIDLSSASNLQHRDEFRNFVKWIVDLDNIVSEVDNKFFGNETVLLGFAAAIGFAHRHEKLQQRVGPAMTRLLEEAKKNLENPIGVLTFNDLRRGIDVRKRNVGEATRDLVFRAMREYIIEDGISSMASCWTQSATMI